jgi:O-antigen/teichoic acid export membrane protein
MRALKLHLRELWSAFVHRSGVEVVVGGAVAKGLSFATSVWLVRVLSQSDFGTVSFAQSVLWFFVPLMGWGAQHALFRFGAIANGYGAKARLIRYALRRGWLLTALTAALVFVLAPWLSASLPQAAELLRWLSLQLVSLFLFEVVKSALRILHFNKLYARAEWLYALLLLAMTAALTPWWGAWGYVAALVLAPAGVYLYFRWIFTPLRMKWGGYATENRGFWSYGIFVSLGSVASQLLFIADVFLIGYLLKDEALVGGYRAAALIPMSLLFIPLMYLSVGAVDVAAHFKDRTYLQRYLRQYLLVFGSGAGLLAGLLWWLREPLVVLFFGEEYRDFALVFGVLAAAVAGAWTLRAPFGNLLGLVGLSRINAVVSAVMLAVNVGLNLWLIPLMGPLGAAYTTVAVLWLSGLVSWYFFHRYLRGLE